MSTLAIPSVDISGLLVASIIPEDTVIALRKACNDCGFFYLTGHGISKACLDNVLSLAHRFFQQPMEEKNRIKRKGTMEGGDGARGYQQIGENVTSGRRDFQEAINFVREVQIRADTSGYEILHGPNLWPKYPEDFEAGYRDYFQRLLDIGETMARLFGHALDLGPPHENAGPESEDQDFFVRNTARSFWMSRIVGYPPMCDKDSEVQGNGMSCGEHSDYGCFTMLLNDETRDTLEVLMKDGTWVYANPRPGALIVNIGDMMERWTNGQWRSTRHRVVHREGGYRVSVPFFYEPNFDCVVRPLAKYDSNPDATGGYTEQPYGEYIKRKIKETYPDSV